jgi:hypothetical protein
MTRKVKIAVRMPDGTRRLYVVDDEGMSVETMTRITKDEVPGAAVLLFELPAPFLPVDEPKSAA